MTDLGTLPGGTTSSASTLNEQGQVIGVATVGGGARHGFVWQNGTMTDLGALPGGRSSGVSALNEHDQIVGWSTNKTGQRHAVLWTLRPRS